jgi:ketosteroid isomerase-like protein
MRVGDEGAAVRDTHPAMSEESTTPDPVELTRSLSEAVNRCDLDAAMSLYAPDAVWESPPLGTRFEGLPAIRGFPEDWLSAYDEFWAEPEEILDLGLRLIWRCVGRGPDAQMEFTIVYPVRDGRIFGIEIFWDHAQALEAVGLET